MRTETCKAGNKKNPNPADLLPMGKIREDLDIGIIASVAGSAKGIAAKRKIAELLDREINSVNLFRSKLGKPLCH